MASGDANGTVILENNSVVYKMLNRVITWMVNSRNTWREVKKIWPHKNLYTKVNSIIIHNSQKVESTQISISDY